MINTAIQPGIGLNPLRFGMTRKEVFAIMGRPEEVEQIEYLPDFLHVG